MPTIRFRALITRVALSAFASRALRIFLNRRSIEAALGAMLVCILGFGALPAHAATITVTANAADLISNNGVCTLREAITNINDGAQTKPDCVETGVYGTSDTIIIPAGTYTTQVVGLDDLNAGGDYDINRSMTITGAGAGSTTINGNGVERVFQITGAYTVSISGVTITAGAAGAGGLGGGIRNDGGNLTITNCVISANTTGANGLGGGVYNTGTVTITNSTISGNTMGLAGWGGGV